MPDERQAPFDPDDLAIHERLTARWAARNVPSNADRSSQGGTMRILNLIQRYYPARGGAEQHLHQIASRQVAAGHHSTVLTSDALDFELFWQPDRGRISPREEVIDGVRVLRFPVQHLPGTPLTYRGTRRLLWLLSRVPGTESLAHQLARFTPYVPTLRPWLQSTGETFDLVVGVNICYEGFLEAAYTFARDRGLPLVLHPLTHLGSGPDPGTDSVSQFYTMRHQVHLVRSATANVMMSPAEQDFYVKRGVPARRLAVLGTAVDPEEVLGGVASRGRDALGVQGPLILALGTLSRDKGSIQTVEAVRWLWRSGREVELVLAGSASADFRSYLERLPAAARARLHVLGRVSDDMRRDLLAACDMLVMPSRADSFGIVFLEAWLYEKPVIGADTWGIRDGVIEVDEDGLIVPFGDVPALAGAMSTLLDQPTIAQAMGARGCDKVLREYVWEKRRRQVESLYQSALQAAGS